MFPDRKPVSSMDVISNKAYLGASKGKWRWWDIGFGMMAANHRVLKGTCRSPWLRYATEAKERHHLYDDHVPSFKHWCSWGVDTGKCYVLQEPELLGKEAPPPCLHRIQGISAFKGYLRPVRVFELGFPGRILQSRLLSHVNLRGSIKGCFS